MVYKVHINMKLCSKKNLKGGKIRDDLFTRRFKFQKNKPVLNCLLRLFEVTHGHMALYCILRSTEITIPLQTLIKHKYHYHHNIKRVVLQHHKHLPYTGKKYLVNLVEFIHLTILPEKANQVDGIRKLD